MIKRIIEEIWEFEKEEEYQKYIDSLNTEGLWSVSLLGLVKGNWTIKRFRTSTMKSL